MGHYATWFFFWSLENRLKKDVRANTDLCYKCEFTESNGFVEEPGGRVTVLITNMETIMS